MKKLLNPELLDLHQKNLQESEFKLIDHQPNLKRIKLEVNNSLDLSNSESSDEGIQCNSSPKQENQQNTNKSVLLSTNDNIKSSLNNVNNDLHNAQILITKSNNFGYNTNDLEIFKADLLNTRQILDKERKLRMKLEEQVRSLENKLYPTRIKEIAQQVQMQFQAGTNPFQTFSLQANDHETSVPVQSVVMLDQVNQSEDAVAETVEVETINLIASNNHQHLLNQTHLNNLNNLNKEPTVNNSSTLHLTLNSLPSDLQSISNSVNNNLISVTNQPKDNKLIMEVVPNKILTSTAYVTTGFCTVQQNQFKPKNFARTDKNVNKQKQNNQNKNSSSASSNNSQNSAITTSTSKKTQANTLTTLSNSSVTSSTSSKTINQNESAIKKDKQQKKTKHIASTPSNAVPLYPNVSVKELVTYNNTEISTTNATNCKLIEHASTLQNPTNETATEIQMIENCNIVTSTLDVPTINKTNKSATSNNLDTIVEAIRHLEGDMFGDQNSSCTLESKRQLDKIKLKNDDKGLDEQSSRNKEVKELSNNQQILEHTRKDNQLKNNSNSSDSRQDGVTVSSINV